jgi:hypothetical protein
LCGTLRPTTDKVRWHARFCTETPEVTLEAGRLVLDLLSALAGGDARPAARGLRELLGSYDRSLAEPLRRWEADLAAKGGERRPARSVRPISV